MKIVDYAVAFASEDLGHLEFAVKQMMKEGWQPFGGVSASLSESDDYKYCVWAQAMVKYKE